MPRAPCPGRGSGHYSRGRDLLARPPGLGCSRDRQHGRRSGDRWPPTAQQRSAGAPRRDLCHTNGPLPSERGCDGAVRARRCDRSGARRLRGPRLPGRVSAAARLRRRRRAPLRPLARLCPRRPSARASLGRGQVGPRRRHGLGRTAVLCTRGARRAAPPARGHGRQGGQAHGRRLAAQRCGAAGAAPPRGGGSHRGGGPAADAASRLAHHRSQRRRSRSGRQG